MPSQDHRIPLWTRNLNILVLPLVTVLKQRSSVYVWKDYFYSDSFYFSVMIGFSNVLARVWRLLTSWALCQSVFMVSKAFCNKFELTLVPNPPCRTQLWLCLLTGLLPSSASKLPFEFPFPPFLDMVFHACTCLPFGPEHFRRQKKGKLSVSLPPEVPPCSWWHNCVMCVPCVNFIPQCPCPLHKEPLWLQKCFASLLLLGTCHLVGNSTLMLLTTQGNHGLISFSVCLMFSSMGPEAWTNSFY